MGESLPASRSTRIMSIVMEKNGKLHMADGRDAEEKYADDDDYETENDK